MQCPLRVTTKLIAHGNQSSICVGASIGPNPRKSMPSSSYRLPRARETYLPCPQHVAIIGICGELDVAHSCWRDLAQSGYNFVGHWA